MTPNKTAPISLYPHQLANAKRLVKSVRTAGAAIDASDTGTGKTFTSLAVAEALGLKPFIICPLSVGPGWVSKHEALGSSHDSLSWLNYESARRKLPSLPADSLVIFDEAHRIGGPDTLQAQMARDLADRFPVLFLSATPFDSPMRTRAVLHALGKVDWHDWYAKIPAMGCRRAKWLPGSPWTWDGKPAGLNALKAMVSPHMTTTRWTEVSGFPDILIQPVAVPVDKLKVVRAMLAAVHSNPLAETTKQRQALELLRVPAMVEMTADLIAEGKRVVAFFNFTAPLLAYAKKVKCSALHGETPSYERTAMLEGFQRNDNSVLALNAQAGGEGIDLHDEHGHGQVVELLSPPHNPVTYKQCIGRVHRVGSHTKAIVRPVYLAGTIEETKVLPAILRKAENIETLTEQDLM